MRWLLAALLVVLGGCGSNVWHGETSFTEDERAEIEAGNTWLTFHMGLPADVIVWDLPPGGDAPMYSIRDGAVPSPEIARRYSHHRIRFDREQFSAYPHDERMRRYRVLAAHEFGHDHGMRHHAGPGVMNELVDINAVWTLQDIAECCRVGEC